MSAPTGAPATGPTSGSLSAKDQTALADAALLLAPLKRAANVANFNGAFYSVGGALSLMFAIPGRLDVVGLLLGIALLSIGLFERSAARRLCHGDPTAAAHIARTELVALGVMVSYFLLAMFVLPSTSEELREHAAELGSMGDDIQRMADTLTRILYPTLIATVVIVQGLMARYFLRKRADVARYLDEAPEWARKVVESVGN